MENQKIEKIKTPFPREEYSLPKEIIKEAQEELEELERDMKETEALIAEGQKELQEIDELNRIAEEEGFEKISPKEEESTRKLIETMENLIIQSKEVKDRIEKLISGFEDIDRGFLEILKNRVKPKEIN